MNIFCGEAEFLMPCLLSSIDLGSLEIRESLPDSKTGKMH